MPSQSPPPKRIKLESSLDGTVSASPAPEPEPEVDQETCSICLQPYADRTIIPACSHEFCLECVLLWSEQSRRCPLCSGAIGEFLIHNMRSRYDYQKHYLTPLRTSPQPLQPLARRLNTRRQRAAREVQWGRRGGEMQREREEEDRLERSISKRRWIYEHNLYAKHVASNPHTRYRSCPTPAQFSASQDLITRATIFLRRELRVWVNLDVEFLTTFIISLMKAIDIRSESAVKLLAEFLDMDAPYAEGERHRNAEHFAHEVYSYLRSPYKDLFVYDSVAQYDTPPEIIRRPVSPKRPSIWRRSRGERPRSRSASLSWSPSGRQYPSTGDRERDQLLDEHTSGGSNSYIPRRSPSPRRRKDVHSSRRRPSRSRSRDRSLPRRHRRRSPSDERRHRRSHSRTAHSRSNSNERRRRGESPPYERRAVDKGKQREETGSPRHTVSQSRPPLPRHSPNREKDDTPAGDRVQSIDPPQTRTPAVANGKRPERPVRTRNLTLAQSVQAHLGGSSSHNTRPGPSSQPQSVARSRRRTLTERLGVDDFSEPEGVAPETQHAESGTNGVAVDHKERQKAVADAEGASPSAGGRSRDITERLASLKRENRIMSLLAKEKTEVAQNQSRLRKRLLGQLEQQKDHALEKNEGVEQSKALEARLRAQAQLRVRLAAEKRRLASI